MIFDLHIQKLDRSAQSPYVVFGDENDTPTPEDKHRPRPKLTLDIEQWERLGSPVMLALEVTPSGSDIEVGVH